MALNAYLSLTGTQQGKIEGSATQKGREGKIIVIAAEHAVTSPRDVASGQATGRRQHRPFVITKEIDRSSPLLYEAWVNDELLSTWELQFWAPATGGTTAAGKEVMRYTVRLSNAVICDIRFHMLNNKNPELMRFAEYEEVSFVYQKIEWSWVPGGITASDEVQAQRSAPAKRKPAAKSKVRATRKKP